ncbi:YqaJ viral recombinase family protein [Castellaniella sp. S9]|uniref:YqaJ viral recombinase family protein n=1 Tax=Castellaniella sp. S9 TaxID=2993652 RepID=UPI0022B5BA90|nr:YqaJ viral recombinase family protein [Castellaniella sp. S9]
MKIHNLIQGSPGWLEFRLNRHGASEAAAMLGVSTKVKRSELLRMKATGLPQEFSDWVQRYILDYGHEVEALARPIVERMIGEDLYPATCSNEDVGGNLSASCDGLTMLGDTVFEHKQWNEELAESVRAGVLPEEHKPQTQQQLLVTGAAKVKFVVSDGTEVNMVMMDVYPELEYQRRIVDGWRQFDEDLANYAHEPAADPVTAQAQEALPAVFAQVSGSLSVSSNLDLFGVALRAFVDRIPKKPETDQEFADTEAACKRLKEAEDRLAAAEDSALASLTNVEKMRRTVADLKELARQTRLASEKLVKARKEAIRTEIVVQARQDMTAHVASLQKIIPEVKLAVAMPDFGTAIKGLKTLSSIRDAAATALANGKVEANQLATDIRAMLDWFAENVPEEYRGLFRDLDDLVTMAPKHFEVTVSGRVEQHKAQEAARLEADRERIRKEEQAKAEQQLQATPQQVAQPTPLHGAHGVVAYEGNGLPRQPSPQPDEPATLSLGAINTRLAPIGLTAAGLAELGITHSATHKAAKLYRESDFDRICAALIQHIEAVHQTAAA